MTTRERGFFASLENTFNYDKVTLEPPNGTSKQVRSTLGTRFLKWWFDNKCKDLPEEKCWIEP